MNAHEQLQIALEHHKSGKLAEAENIYRAILKDDPDDANALNLLGSLAGQLGRYEEAITLLKKAVALGPTHAQFHGNLGALYQKLYRYDEAIASLRSAITLRLDYAVAHQNLGNAYLAISDLKNAEIELRRAVTLAPTWDAAQNDLGCVYRQLGKLDQAAAQFKAAYNINPNYPDANWNLALIDLLLGDFNAGWKGYEWRARCPAITIRRDIAQPRWTGGNIRGKTILLHAEQGFGDTFQFIRYAPLVAQRGATVIFESQPDLVNVLRSVKGISQIIPFGQPTPAFDTHIPLMSLPLAFDTAPQSIPATMPYITASPERIADWSRRLGPRTKKRIGLAWFGRPTHPDDRRRSIPLQQFAPLQQIKSAQFVSLEINPPDSLLPGLELRDFSADLHDFQDTAALIANLDLVISVDTAVAHLAAAMNKPVWLLLPFIPDWRWLLNRDDSPWYPSMKLFRQASLGDWTTVIAKVTDALRAG